MIFATVGTQLPFPRLIEALVALAPTLGEEIVIQTGTEPAPGWTGPGLSMHRTLTPAEFETHFTAARVVVGHAGIGTILSARRWGKPLVVLPRRHAMGEHRNDHQLATARQVEALPGVHVAWEAADLGPLLARPDLAPPPPATEMGPAHAALVTRLRSFIAG